MHAPGGEINSYDEHPSKAAAWRAGEFIVFPEAIDEYTTVWFACGRNENGSTTWEGLLARRIDANCARIAAIPYWVRGVSLGDEVSVVESAEGAVVAVEVLRASGNATLRVGFHNENRETGRRWMTLMRDLERFDCWFDVLQPDVPGGVGLPRRLRSCHGSPEDARRARARV
jgi:hypothetical protein